MGARTLSFCLLVSSVLIALGVVVLWMSDVSPTGWALLILGGVLSTISVAQASWMTKPGTAAESMVPVRISEPEPHSRGYR